MAKNKTVAAEVKVDPIKMGGDLDLTTEVGKQSDAIRASIEAGDVIPLIDQVTRKVDAVQYSKDYLKLIPINLRGALALSGGVETTWKVSADKDGKDDSDFDGPCLVKDFLYGNDLGVKSKESQRLAVLVEGPDKAKLAAAKNLAKAFNITEAEALAKIEAMA